MSEHLNSAREHLANAEYQGDKVKEARHLRQHNRAVHHAAGERLQLKRAEVNALLAIADELSRIGLGQ